LIPVRAAIRMEGLRLATVPGRVLRILPVPAVGDSKLRPQAQSIVGLNGVAKEVRLCGRCIVAQALAIGHWMQKLIVTATVAEFNLFIKVILTRRAPHVAANPSAALEPSDLLSASEVCTLPSCRLRWDGLQSHRVLLEQRGRLAEVAHVLPLKVRG